MALQPFLSRRRRHGLEPRLDRAVLSVEVGEVGHQVLDHLHMRQRIDLHRAGNSSMPLVQASVLEPSMFIAHEPQMPSRQERRSVSVGSTLFLIQSSRRAPSARNRRGRRNRCRCADSRHRPATSGRRGIRADSVRPGLRPGLALPIFESGAERVHHCWTSFRRELAARRNIADSNRWAPRRRPCRQQRKRRALSALRHSAKRKPEPAQPLLQEVTGSRRFTCRLGALAVTIVLAAPDCMTSHGDRWATSQPCSPGSR